MDRILRTGTVAIDVDARIVSSSTPTRLEEAPGGLFPMVSNAFEMDEWRIRMGWPVEVPEYDIRANTLISTSGELISVRAQNSEVRTGALLRWIPDADYYNMTALSWDPIQDDAGLNVSWRTSPSYAPVLINNYEYRVKDERFYASALNFDSDTRNHMWADFETTIGGSEGYTVLMVMSPNSTYGNDTSVPYNGLWCPGRPTPAGTTFTEEVDPEWLAVTIQGRNLFLASESQAATRTISINTELNSTAPMYLVMVLSRPESVFYVGPGPDAMRVQTQAVGTSTGRMDNWVMLGRTMGDVLHTADMALLDLSIYADRLSASEVADEISILSSVYGGAE